MDMTELNLQTLANRLIAQGITQGRLVLESGQTFQLTSTQVVRLIALVKSAKLSYESEGSESIVPEDFVIPLIDEHEVHEHEVIEDTKPVKETEQSKTEEAAKQKPKVIDFEELERQINKNTQS